MPAQRDLAAIDNESPPFSAPLTPQRRSVRAGGDLKVFGRDNGSTVTRNTDPQMGATTGYTIDPDGPGIASPFTFGNQDFNFRSLRGTGVFRWEYRPGSTLYFVWTHEREGSDQFGDFNFNRDRSALFPDRPTNIFQIKGTYWIGR